MPLLVHAVPLTKSWLGISYWKKSKFEDLPEELEYLPYPEFEDRFTLLDKIARPTYPTIWPNFAILILLAGVVVAATIGIMHTGTNLAIMGQGACFLLPVIIVVWVKVRSETKARSRKKFKHQSQKLLRAWTTLDAEAYAIQWKLRLRPKSVAKRWLGGGNRSTRPELTNSMDAFLQQRQQQDQLGLHDEQEHFNAGTAALTMEQALRLDQTHENVSPTIALTIDVAAADTSTSAQQPIEIEQDYRRDSSIYLEELSRARASTYPPVLTPSPIAAVYHTLRINTQLRRAAALESNASAAASASATGDGASATTTGGVLDTFTTAVNIPLPDSASPNSPSALHNTLPMPTTTTSTSSNHPDPMFPSTSTWTSFGDWFRGSCCLRYLFRERKVWLIEISLRDCQLDEYALTVPSPVYCDYRLPGYEDIMLITAVGSATTGTGIGTMAVRGASSSRVGLHRYQGEPPAYESDSDDESDQDEDEEEEEELDQDLARVRHAAADFENGDRLPFSTTRTTATMTTRTVTRVSSVEGSILASQRQTEQEQQIPEMAMVQRPVDLSSIVVQSLVGPGSSSSDTSSSTTTQKTSV